MVFFLLLLIVISWCIWYCSCSPSRNYPLHHFFLHTSNPVERLLFRSHFFGLSTGSVSDLAFVPKDQTWVTDEHTQVYALTELIIWQLFLLLVQQLPCSVHPGGKTNKPYKLNKWEREWNRKKEEGRGRMNMFLELLLWEETEQRMVWDQRIICLDCEIW